MSIYHQCDSLSETGDTALRAEVRNLRRHVNLLNISVILIGAAQLIHLTVEAMR